MTIQLVFRLRKICKMPRLLLRYFHKRVKESIDVWMSGFTRHLRADFPICKADLRFTWLPKKCKDDNYSKVQIQSHHIPRRKPSTCPGCHTALTRIPKVTWQALATAEQIHSGMMGMFSYKCITTMVHTNNPTLYQLITVNTRNIYTYIHIYISIYIH